MLTNAESEKLKKTNPRDKANDFIVRRKFQKWLDNLPVVFGIILRYLPQKQIKRLITGTHIINLINILSYIFSITTVPMVRKNETEYVAVLPHHPPRAAEKEEIAITNSYLKPLIHLLFRHLSVEDVREVMQVELSRNQPEYILVKKAFSEYPSYVTEEPTNSSKTQIVIH